MDWFCLCLFILYEMFCAVICCKYLRVVYVMFIDKKKWQFQFVVQWAYIYLLFNAVILKLSGLGYTKKVKIFSGHTWEKFSPRRDFLQWWNPTQITKIQYCNLDIILTQLKTMKSQEKHNGLLNLTVYAELGQLYSSFNASIIESKTA